MDKDFLKDINPDKLKQCAGDIKQHASDIKNIATVPEDALETVAALSGGLITHKVVQRALPRSTNRLFRLATLVGDVGLSCAGGALAAQGIGGLRDGIQEAIDKYGPKRASATVDETTDDIPEDDTPEKEILTEGEPDKEEYQVEEDKG